MKKFDHSAFQVSDIDKAIKWYCDILGFELLFKGANEGENEVYCFLSYGESRLELIQDLGQEFEKPVIKKPFCPHVCLQIDSMKAALKLIKKHNIHVIKGPLEIKDEETWIYFADPDNNVLEFIEWYNKK
jgi:lactoylglutathione lyase